MRGKSLLLATALCLAVSAQAGEYKIGYSCNNFNDTFQTYIVDAAREFVATVEGVVLEVSDAQEDTVRQGDQIDTFIQSGVDALVVVPVNTTAVQPYVRAAARANVPLIFVNRNPYPDGKIPENVYFIGADSTLEGETQMEAAGAAMGGKGNIVILVGMLSNEASHARTQGVKNVIAAKYPNIKVLAEETANWQRDQGMTVMENWMTAYGDQINGVCSNNDEMALGALNALQKSGRKDVVVYGVDAIPDALVSIGRGEMTGTLLQDPVGQGKGSVEMALNILRGIKPAQQINKLPAVLINKDNVASYR
ncbi:MAG: substrate-binding domain-containing protein [Planctomycetes bacterium]|nr:substrate-binding domain-containing protein [Planctomycetota bacterium]